LEEPPPGAAICIELLGRLGEEQRQPASSRSSVFEVCDERRAVKFSAGGDME
jgi:hypothetical protein